jgi:ubiquinone/menaquinone biosynthesis C-methylase UbiE
MIKLGTFGEFVKQYEKARRPYPAEVFAFLKRSLRVKKPLILDLGCGTGISTRQLTKVGTVIGCDPDPRMLAAARKHTRPKVKKYTVGSADKLPFADETFDAVTAFAALHWFSDKKSVEEIKRVLKPNGLFFVVSKEGVKQWGEGYRRNIIKIIKRNVAPFRGGPFNPRAALVRNGFKNIKTMTWKKTERFTVANAVEYVQSVSIWNSVPKRLRSKATVGLQNYFRNMRRKSGKIEKQFLVKVVVGSKP